jgi:hypothetical protein
VVVTVTKNGNLKRNRNIWTGRYIPAGVETMGKNGAIPDPEGDALARAHVLVSPGTAGCTNLDRGTVSTSPWRTACARRS